jgi:hypothetical protein
MLLSAERVSQNFSLRAVAGAAMLIARFETTSELSELWYRIVAKFSRKRDAA